MNNNMIRKFIGLILALSLLLCTSVPSLADEVNANIWSSSINEVKTNMQITVIGDSIAYGFGVKQEKTWANLVCKAISMRLKYNEYVKLDNFAIPGYDTTDLLDMVSLDLDLHKSLKTSDIVLLNVGGNILLHPVEDTINEILKSKGKTKISELCNGNMSDMAPVIRELLNSKRLERRFKEEIHKFESEFPLIIEKILEINPSARIYVNNIYCPLMITSFYALIDKLWYRTSIASFGNTWIQPMNIFIANNQGNKYRVVDIYSAIDKYGIDSVGFNFATKSLDPHPTEAGHRVFTEAILRVMEANGEFDHIDGIQEPILIKNGGLNPGI